MPLLSRAPIGVWKTYAVPGLMALQEPHVQNPLKSNFLARPRVGLGRLGLILCCGVVGIFLMASGPLLIAGFIRLTLVIADVLGLI